MPKRLCPTLTEFEMTDLPRPRALELRSRGAPSRRPRPPFGLSSWSERAESIAVLLDASAIDTVEATQIADQIPRAEELPRETAVYVLPVALAPRQGIARWLGDRAVPVSREARCGALLIRGYVGIRAEVDRASGLDLVCAVSSLCVEIQPACPQVQQDPPSTP